MKKQLLTLSIITLVLLIATPFVTSYQQLCLTYGESIPPEGETRYTCRHDICQICVTDNYFPTAPYKCKTSCEPIGSSSVDSEPPIQTIDSPVNQEVYNSRNVPFVISSDEPISLYYIDNIDGRGRWKRIGSNVDSYSKSLSFKDGFNNITIKGVDRNGNPTEVIKEFYVDSQDPKIKKIEVDNQGGYYVEFDEANPVELVFHYGNVGTDFNEYSFDMGGDCVEGKPGKYTCEKHITILEYLALISPYSGQTIEYWFEIVDMANNKYESRGVEFYVDITPPVLNNPDSYWQRDGKYLYLNLDITEENLEEVSYIDNNDKSPKWKTLCSKLKDGFCTKKLSLKDGQHDIDIKILDEVGNPFLKNLEIFTDSKKPKIRKTGVDNLGDSILYSVEFDEANPVELVFHYGNVGTSFSRYELNILEDCQETNNDKYVCEKEIGLLDYLGLVSPYSNQMIEYWFEVTDIVENTGESKKQEFYVDITPPVLNNPGEFWVQGEDRLNKYIYFNLNITEENLDEIAYIDRADRRPKWKRLCSKLRDGMCTVKKSFKEGYHDVDVQITDEAGNAIGESIVFEVV